MSDTFDDFALSEDEESRLDPNIRAQLRRSRELGQKAAEAEARAAAADKRVAFLEAGIPQGPLGEMFRKSYDGELDADQIKAAWQVIAPETPAPAGEQVNQNAENLAAGQRINAAGAGESGAAPGAREFKELMEEAFEEGFAKGDRRPLLELIANAPDGATDFDGRKITLGIE